MTKLNTVEEFKEFFTFINACNQDFKNLKINGLYTWCGNTVYAVPHDSEPLDVLHCIIDVNYSKLKYCKEFFNNLDTLIDGIELFRFIKDHKKIVKTIEIVDGHLIIGTGSAIEFNSKPVMSSEVIYTDDYERYEEFADRIEVGKPVLKAQICMKSDEIAEVLDRPFATIINVGKYQLKGGRSYFSKFKGQDTSIKIYPMKNYKGFCLVEMSISKQKYNMKSFFVISS